MAAEMDWWVSNTGIDGFRCDMAGMVPYAFWEHAIPMLREKHGPLFFLAEWSEPHLLSTFNADYGWELHHLMNDIAKGHKSVHELEVYAAKNDTLYGDDAMKLYFTPTTTKTAGRAALLSAWATMHAPSLLWLL